MIVKLTGIDTAGKSTTADALVRHGFSSHYNAFDPERRDLFAHYSRLLKYAGDGDLVWDRGFITEHVYGPVLRGRSRLSEVEFLELLHMLAAAPAMVVHVREDAETLDRRLDASSVSIPVHAEVRRSREGLESRYHDVLEIVGRHVPVIEYRPSAAAIDVVLAEIARCRPA